MNSYSSNVMIGTKNILRLTILFFSIFLLAQQDLKATHIVGGDLTYRCLGGGIYELKLTMRRDCLNGGDNAQFDDPAYIGMYDGITHQPIKDILGYPDGWLLLNYNDDDTLNEFVVSDCSVVSGDVCVHTTMYVQSFILPYRASGYTLAYQRCCRNMTLNNIVDPLNTGMTIVAELSGLAQQECNSSPQFLAYPNVYICANKDIDFDHHAVDFEGDSLVYSLCTPYAGGDIINNQPKPASNPPYDLVTWKTPYNLSNLLGGVPLKIDVNTGKLSGKPNAVGQYVIGICVTAYKRGTNLITGVTRRDFQYNVRMCRDVPVANFSAPTLDCENPTLTVTFDNQTVLADNYIWYFDWKNVNDHGNDSIVDVFEPSWTYDQEGFYKVALIVRDSGMFCYDTIIHEVGVFNSQIDAGFTYDVSSCTEEGITLNVLDQSNGFNANFPACTYEWLVSVGGNVFPSTLQNPTFHFDIEELSTVCLSLVVTSCNGCSATQTECFPVQEITIPVNPASDSICNGESTNLLLNADCALTYIWSPAVLDSCLGTVSPTTNTEYFLTVTDGLCEVTTHTAVAVQQLPVLAFDYQTDCKSLTAQFSDSNSVGAILVHWDFGIPNDPGSDENNTVKTFPDSGIYTITLSSRDGCDVSTSQQITVNAISEELDTATTNCFFPSIPLNPVYDSTYLYLWSNGSTLPNPSVTVADDKTYYVTISSPGLPGCEIVDSIRVIIPDAYLLEAGDGDSIINCTVQPVTLTASVTGVSSDDLEFFWTIGVKPEGTGKTIIVNPDTTTTYTVTTRDSLGCTKSDDVTVFKSDPGFDVLASNDTAYCDRQIINLHAFSSGGVSFEWFNEAGDLIGSDADVQVTPPTPSCFRVVGTDVFGCQDDTTVCLTPTFFNLDITGGQGICLDEETEICVTNNHPEQNLTYIWSNILETPCISVSPSVTTTYAVTVTNFDLGCIDTLSSTVTVNLFNPIDVIITSNAQGDSIILGAPEPVQLFVNQSPTFGYTWTSTGGDIVPSVWNPIISPTVAGDITYTVTVINAEGCPGIASITMHVLNPPCNDDDIFLPTAFTPNNDGHNDELKVLSNFISLLDLHIYNRWGQEVFHTTNPNIGWDGTFKGEELSPDVFGYYMNITCPNEKTFFKKGNITLLR
ncbi:MAG TPA: gliding motility-associated C-terminal domain-containing protein [Saprospiraceae bacterium]|nr:gliding motility-associated C-terminal domain-containing protein [Saprospiraceae bacterium]